MRTAGGPWSTNRRADLLLRAGLREHGARPLVALRVYFAQLTDGGPVKIGSSPLPRQRVHGMHHLFGQHLTYLGDVPGSRTLEYRWHELFQEYREVQEWFRPHPFVIETIRYALLQSEVYEQRGLPYLDRQQPA